MFQALKKRNLFHFGFLPADVGRWGVRRRLIIKLLELKPVI
jgi:hypothetical protein